MEVAVVRPRQNLSQNRRWQLSNFRFSIGFASVSLFLFPATQNFGRLKDFDWNVTMNGFVGDE